ncbi:ribosome assembly RNA-binding protein YhbY [Levilactobacillus suantsaii]|uniref:Ribosome assembly RNA-binding protein YhbY n=1 Tax=Levilactobacillus suantsaii TaxID=2292255 RepID=A0A4Q0VIY4_9LACO|nr:ribosome assembly RNA-binding protein YhbY [Levilactobacillus suantsaii]QMU07822.1 ribosome assembly RNA-binding protein YhbY [Levilactobacillus suantsaii]RXI79451.1 ribosome assembly RNA-binding protein YhbY [Levilactobacillus suantsaii]
MEENNLLRGKQKRYLRAQAHSLRPIFSVGKNGLTQVWLDQLTGALEKRELIKINLQQSAEATVAETKTFIETNTDIQVVQTIGRVLVLYRPATAAENQRFSPVVEEM